MAGEDEKADVEKEIAAITATEFMTGDDLERSALRNA
jgi:hypothetical protein